MKLSQAKEYILYHDAQKEGKIVEWRVKNSSDLPWREVVYLLDEPIETLQNYDFRIKPTPTLRPWKPEEVPVGALIRIKNVLDVKGMICGYSHDGDTYQVYYGFGYRTLKELAKDCEHSLDHGKTWLPCGVEE